VHRFHYFYVPMTCSSRTTTAATTAAAVAAAVAVVVTKLHMFHCVAVVAICWTAQT
jgi:hypothetical protein